MAQIHHLWTKEEDAVIQRWYGVKTVREIMDLLPSHRSRSAVIGRANRLKLSSDLNRSLKFEDTPAPKPKVFTTGEVVEEYQPYLHEFLDPIWRQKFVRGEVKWKSRGAL